MKIYLIPQRRDDHLSLSRSGDILTINGAQLDLTGIPEGATLPAAAVGCEWIAGPIRRTSGELELMLILPHGPDAPLESLFPEPLHITANGAIALPDWGTDQ